MVTITINVTPLSAKIMLAEYGQQPIRLERKDLISDYLRSVRLNNKGYKPRTFRWLSESVEIAVHCNLARIALQKNSNVGIALFNYHREVLLRYVDALHSTGIPASTAIEMFYEKYGITEWDYSYEAAYRRWVDYKRTKSEKKPLPADCRKQSLQIGHSEDHLIKAVETIMQQVQANQKRVGTRLSRQLRYYVLYKYGSNTLQRVGIICGTSTSAAYRGVKSVERIISSDRFLRKTVQSVIQAVMS